MRFFTEKPKQAIPRHKWFAWYPVWGTYCTQDNLHTTAIWLEYVWRYKYKDGVIWHYEVME